MASVSLESHPIETSVAVTPDKVCECKGIRTCLICEGVKSSKFAPYIDNPNVFYSVCCNCGEAKKYIEPPSEVNLYCNGNTCVKTLKSELLIENLIIEGMVLDGIHLVKEFISELEEIQLISIIDSIEWKNSQSGRRKQNYGPKVNFKRKKLKLGEFTGLPPYAEGLVKKINSLKTFSTFKPVEFCNLEYTAEKGASIDPHYDDKWVWGDRLISISTLSDSVITFYSQDLSVQVALPLPRRSFLGFWGSSRFNWLHGVKRKDIDVRRVSITLRELNKAILDSPDLEEIGDLVIETGSKYHGNPT
ncbi:Alpha-ketoglutarate-dependent dioxygenase alkB-like protein 4-like [Oopsacas minuta]|uniref:Alpha-ketoglutarate-dependent dioxygenase alkB-like protein 4-like n=1 Tax=Oopsacas minuta TaxID=111878 RepID=A0AAV7JZK2_9METZ|nr:Alpha-ketoglutarate-dependent dioxygenase alkB-like protein 4-like [Oopsacas minuta]